MGVGKSLPLSICWSVTTKPPPNGWHDPNNPDARHPVLIVVANTKDNAYQLYRYLGGYRQDGVHVKGEHDILSNVPFDGCTSDECRERTMLVSGPSGARQASGAAASMVAVCCLRSRSGVLGVCAVEDSRDDVGRRARSTALRIT